MMLAMHLLTTLLWTETLYPEWSQQLRVDEMLVEEKTSEQDLLIFRNGKFGVVLALNGAVQITEADEYTYQEMMAHVPILAHGNVKKVLIIGGGDGGVMREVLRHSTVEKVTLVEIDREVIERSKKYLPMISQGSFDNPRAEVVIQDGIEFLKNTDQKFDVIMCDSSDPIGPATVLFSSPFYEYCKKALAPDGIFVKLSGVPFMQEEEFVETHRNLARNFKDASFYLVDVPTYIGGFMTIGFATDRLDYRQVSEEEIAKRMANIQGSFKYYNPQIHKASFALPQFMHESIQSALNK